MTEFFSSMEPTQRFYWYLAIGISIIFVIQTVLTFIGASADTDIDFDTDTDIDLDAGAYPFQLFSLRNLINFLLGFGWGGVSLYNSIDSGIILALVAALIGLLFVAVFFLIMKTLMKFSEDNTFSIESTIFKTGEVYLTIPAERTGKGKVLISVDGSIRELDAITDSKEAIKNGSPVMVVRIEGDILVVEPLSKI